MTYRIAASHDQTAAADAGTSSASPRKTLATLLAPDDIVRPEMRDAAILGAKCASRGTRPTARHHHTLARRS